MYVDGWMLFAIYFIAVASLAVSAYALWSLEEIRKYYSRNTNSGKYTRTQQKQTPQVRRGGHWD